MKRSKRCGFYVPFFIERISCKSCFIVILYQNLRDNERHSFRIDTYRCDRWSLERYAQDHILKKPAIMERVFRRFAVSKLEFIV